MAAKKYLIVLIVLLSIFFALDKIYAIDYHVEDIPGDTYNAKTDENNLSSYTSDKCSNNGSCFKGLGLRLRLIRYDKSESDEEHVISTIYILNPNMLTDTVLVNGARLPGSEADFANPGYDISYLDPSEEHVNDNPENVNTENTPVLAKQDGLTHGCGDGTTVAAVNNIYMFPQLHTYNYPVPGCNSPSCPLTGIGQNLAVGYEVDPSGCKILGNDYYNLMKTLEAKKFPLPFLLDLYPYKKEQERLLPLQSDRVLHLQHQ